MIDEIKNDALEAESQYRTAVESANDYIENFDILETITNVGNDEVFTPRKTCDMILNSLPEEVWHNPNYKWLNPATKNGIFEREIALRLDEGLKEIMPDEESRRKHILQNMIFSIGQTKFTSNVARRTLYYCSQANRKCDGELAEDGHYVNGYAIGNGAWFETNEGNILTPSTEHIMDPKTKRCKFCGVAIDSKYIDEKQREHYAYEFIHVYHLVLEKHLANRFFKGDKNMKFDIIIGNPPYQISTAKLTTQQNADPIYHLFIEQALCLNAKYISMIVPSRWMTGGKTPIEFRKEMLSSKHMAYVHDFENADEIFPNNEIKGGVCYFLIDKSKEYKQTEYFYHATDGTVIRHMRKLNELGDEMFIRDYRGASIVNKVIKSSDFKDFSSLVSSQTPFGIISSFTDFKEKATGDYSIRFYGRNTIGFTKRSNATKNQNLIDKYKVLAPKAVGEGKLGLDKIKPFVAEVPSICSQTYLIYGPVDNIEQANNLCDYMKTKFFHFLLGQLKKTQDCPPTVFKFVPKLDFNEKWTDKKLYEKYNLTEDEIKLIEETIWKN